MFIWPCKEKREEEQPSLKWYFFLSNRVTVLDIFSFDFCSFHSILTFDCQLLHFFVEISITVKPRFTGLKLQGQAQITG